MSTFNVHLFGEGGDAKKITKAFEEMVRSLRSASTTPTGRLQLVADDEKLSQIERTTNVDAEGVDRPEDDA